MKKVLFVATVVKLHIMVFHLPYLKLFKENGYEVHVAARNDFEKSDLYEIPFCDKYYDFPFERAPLKKANIQVYRNLKKIIDSNRFDIIHCHTPMGGVIGRLAAREARKKGTKIIYTAHGFHFFKGASISNWLIYYPVERWLARYTDVLITINKEDFNTAYNFKANRVEYVQGVGIYVSKFKSSNFNRTEKRKSIGISEHDFMIISVGELNRNKNHQSIIRAISTLNNKKVKYILCGTGPLENDLIKLVKELYLENQVIFLGFRSDISELMNAADLFVFPSIREGLSLSLMEAMASGLPIVCSKIRGNIDLIDEGEGGYLVKPFEIEAFAKYIKIMIENNSIRSCFSKYNLKKVENYSIESVIEVMRKIYF